MDLNKLWINKETDDKSVSLTMVVVAFLAVLVANGLELAKVTESTASLMELFYATAGLYWGRKFTSAKGTVVDNTKGE